MSERCSLGCRYCYLKEIHKTKEQFRAISVEFAKKGIDDFFSGTSSRHIRFFAAGEPTLEWCKMREIREYAARKAGNSLYTELQTNGFFSDKICNWIIDNVDMTWISCDGPPELQDFHRPTLNGSASSHIVERNIQKIASLGKEIGVRATISNLNIDRQEEMIDYYQALGVKAVFADHMCLPVASTACSRNGKKLVEVEAYKYAQTFLRAKKYAERKGMFYSNFLLTNFDEPVSISCRCMLPAPHLTPSNLVSACDMVTEFTGSPLDDLIYGHYSNGTIFYDAQKIEKIRSRTIENIPECRLCPIKEHCAGGCLGEAINETESFWGVKKQLCSVVRYLSEQLLPTISEPYPYLHP